MSKDMHLTYRCQANICTCFILETSVLRSLTPRLFHGSTLLLTICSICSAYIEYSQVEPCDITNIWQILTYTIVSSILHILDKVKNTLALSG